MNTPLKDTAFKLKNEGTWESEEDTVEPLTVIGLLQKFTNRTKRIWIVMCKFAHTVKGGSSCYGNTMSLVKIASKLENAPKHNHTLQYHGRLAAGTDVCWNSFTNKLLALGMQTVHRKLQSGFIHGK